jgi:hypothetical protein
MPNKVLRESALSVEVIGEEEFTNDLAGDPFKEGNKLPERSTSVAWDHRWGELRVVGVVLINEPELL